MLNSIHTKRIEAEKNGNKDGKAMYKLMMLYMEKQWKT